MPETQEATVDITKDAVANVKNFTTIPNSTADFCIYTYKAEHESVSQITRAGFFDSAALFLNVGDCIRVFRFDDLKNLTNYLELIVLNVDKINRKVSVASLVNHNLENKRIK